MDDRISYWLEKTDNAIGNLLPLYAPVTNNRELTEDQTGLLRRFSTACLEVTGSTLVLLENNKVWDAEITLRTVLEGSLKFIYLLSSRENFAARYQEFVFDLPDIASLRSHDRADQLLRASGTADRPYLQPFRDLLIPVEQQSELRVKYPRNVRHDLEEAWSVTRIISTLSKSQLLGAQQFPTFLYGYWSSSQFAHMSYEGLFIPVERRMREESRREAVELAHFGRILSDCYSYSLMRLHVSLEFFKADLAPLREIVKKNGESLAGITGLWQDWHSFEYPEQPW